MSTNLEYRARERQKKKKQEAGQRTSTRKRGQRSRTDLEREIKKNKGDIFFRLEEQHENFLAAVAK